MHARHSRSRAGLASPTPRHRYLAGPRAPSWRARYLYQTPWLGMADHSVPGGADGPHFLFTSERVFPVRRQPKLTEERLPFPGGGDGGRERGCGSGYLFGASKHEPPFRDHLLNATEIEHRKTWYQCISLQKARPPITLPDRRCNDERCPNRLSDITCCRPSQVADESTDLRVPTLPGIGVFKMRLVFANSCSRGSALDDTVSA